MYCLLEYVLEVNKNRIGPIKPTESMLCVSVFHTFAVQFGFFIIEIKMIGSICRWVDFYPTHTEPNRILNYYYYYFCTLAALAWHPPLFEISYIQVKQTLSPDPESFPKSTIPLPRRRPPL